ncbi:ABC transporter ATP-binding protein [Clostridiaceae bacterium HSG29]|nr:ABC transporter ATP-binding protein [Clostridiaceae bacterium HSG29]
MIKLDKIWKVYDTGKIKVEALRGIDLEIKAGEFVSIVGASGSGKSTMMNILGCLDRPTNGKYKLNGNYIEGLDEDELARIRNKNVGFIFQTFNLVPRVTAFHNVELPLIYSRVKASERERRVTIALERVGLSDRMTHKPNELSGGQKQRVAIARALVNNPSIILADEPTGNLDSETTIEIMEIFKKLNASGATVIIVTHEMEIAAITNRQITFKDGKIISDKLNNCRNYEV